MGGIVQSVNLFGKKYKARFGRSPENKNEYGFTVEEKKLSDLIAQRFFYLFPLVDLLIVILYYADFSFIFDKVAKRLPSVPIPSVSLPFETVLLIANIVCISLLITYFLGLYFIMLRGVRKWHGCEHKVISAAENNDIDNAKKYSPIHERCGGTLMPTIFVGYAIWGIVVWQTGFAFGFLTFVTVLIYFNVKYFHKYDKVGIWFGKWLQRHATVSEPDDWQLELGKVAMKNLYLAETGKEYVKTKVVLKEGEMDEQKSGRVVSSEEVQPL